MDIKRISITSLLCFIIILLIYINIGLNISGPLNYEKHQDEVILNTVKKRFPLINELYRHSFKYITYSYYNDTNVYIFDDEGSLVVIKDFNSNMFEEIKQIALNNYGIEDADIHIGFGYASVVYVIEEDDIILLIDYDTKEVVYYLKGNLL